MISFSKIVALFFGYEISRYEEDCLLQALLKVPARSVAMGCNVNSRDLCNFFSKIHFIEKGWKYEYFPTVF